MSELVEFLKARLNDDEQSALAATPSPWISHRLSSRDQATIVQDLGRRSITGDPIGAPVVASTYRPSGMANAEHIARHDPARVLREVAAKRRLLAEYAEYQENDTEKRYEYADGWANGLGFAVRLLALAYADHEDYRVEWAT